MDAFVKQIFFFGCPFFFDFFSPVVPFSDFFLICTFFRFFLLVVPFSVFAIGCYCKIEFFFIVSFFHFCHCAFFLFVSVLFYIIEHKNIFTLIYENNFLRNLFYSHKRNIFLKTNDVKQDITAMRCLWHPCFVSGMLSEITPLN